MDLEDLMLNEISQRKMYTYMWNLKNKTNEQIQQNRNRVIDTDNNLGVARGLGVGDERNRWGRLRGTNFQLQNKMSHRYEIHSMRNIVSNSGISLYVDGW